MLALVATFFIGVLVGLLGRWAKLPSWIAIFLSYGVAWLGLVLFAAMDTARNGQPTLGSAVFIGMLGLLLSLPACGGCALALMGRDSRST